MVNSSLINRTKKQSGVLCSKELNITPKTVSKYFRFFRNKIVSYYLNNYSKIGGKDDIIEIDESLFGKRKYHKGKFVLI